MSRRSLLASLGLCLAGYLSSKRSAGTFVLLPAAELNRVEIPAAKPSPGASKASTRGIDALDAAAVGCSCLGLALAGVSLTAARRRPSVGLWAHRGNVYSDVYGGDGPPVCPPWIKDGKRGTRGKEGASKLEYPAWMTVQKWETFTCKDRARSLRWFLMVHDDQGNRVFDKKEAYTIEEAIDLQIAMYARAPVKFDPAIECSMQMNLDPKYPNQQIRMSIKLPHGTGKNIRVAVFCDEKDGDEAKAAGACIWGDDLLQAIESDKMDFDVLIAKMDMMPRLAKLGRILGPKRLMPSPKSGTVVTDFKQGVDDFSGGLIELRNDQNMLVGCSAGRLSFGKKLLMENFKAVLQGMADKRPDGAKMPYWQTVYLGSTMGPSIKIKESEFPAIKIAEV